MNFKLKSCALLEIEVLSNEELISILLRFSTFIPPHFSIILNWQVEKDACRRQAIVQVRASLFNVS